MFLSQLAEIIVTISHDYLLRVAIDDVDAAGKTMLADELVPVLEKQGKSVIRASIDGFDRPRRERYQRGHDSAEGYYEDAFDYVSLREVLLLPLGPNGSRQYRRAVFDLCIDAPLPTRE